MHYPIANEPGDDKHAFGGVVPDLPGCFSAGDSLGAAMTQARDVIPLHLEGLLDGINTIADDGYQARFPGAKCSSTTAAPACRCCKRVTVKRYGRTRDREC